MKHLMLEVIHQRQVADGFMELTMTWPDDVPAPQPGQFFTLRIGDGPSPLLRRPFAFSAFIPGDGVSGALVRCIYQKRGTATQAMSGCHEGEKLDVLAPLGTCFPRDLSSDNNSDPGRPVLLAGGVGIGPMLFTAESLRKYNPVLVIGARTKDLLPLNALPHDMEILIATDDGSYGIHGTVIEALQQCPPNNSEQDHSRSYGIVMACGPNPMLAAAHEWSVKNGLTCLVSMEQTMGCAVGACMGCVIPVHGPQPYARVCMEGPVFSSEIIDWEGLKNA